MQQIKLGALLLTILLAGCQTVAGSETNRVICRELDRDLPTYSKKDTPQTLESGARFIEVFESVCRDFLNR